MSAMKQANDSEIINQREGIQNIHWKNYLETNIYKNISSKEIKTFDW